ncbi:hypothetical protein Xoosp13_148 [Xanthomonas phage Xoo-sp13]|nr:hypothetical protein Xoosp13_148 [Xanthomonas phage Xoo-sp13]
MEMAYRITYYDGTLNDPFVTEWIWCHGDNSINIVHPNHGTHVSIYVNEKLVGKFSHNALLLKATHSEGIPVEEVHSEMVDFIKRWCIWI